MSRCLTTSCCRVRGCGSRCVATSCRRVRGCGWAGLQCMVFLRWIRCSGGLVGDRSSADPSRCSDGARHSVLHRAVVCTLWCLFLRALNGSSFVFGVLVYNLSSSVPTCAPPFCRCCLAGLLAVAAGRSSEKPRELSPPGAGT